MLDSESVVMAAPEFREIIDANEELARDNERLRTIVTQLVLLSLASDAVLLIAFAVAWWRS